MITKIKNKIISFIESNSKVLVVVFMALLVLGAGVSQAAFFRTTGTTGFHYGFSGAGSYGYSYGYGYQYGYGYTFGVGYGYGYFYGYHYTYGYTGGYNGYGYGYLDTELSGSKQAEGFLGADGKSTSVTATPGATSFTVNYTTSYLAKNRINYGATESFGSNTDMTANQTGANSIQITGLTCGTTYYYRVETTDAGNNIWYSTPTSHTTATFACPGAGGLIGYWPFDGDVTDKSSGGHDLTDSGTSNISGALGSARNFNGTVKLSYSDNTPFNFGTSPFSVNVWVKTTVSGAYPYVMATLPESSPYKGWAIRQHSDDSIQLYQNSDIGIGSTGHVNDGNWHMLTIKRDSTYLYLYIDGVLDTYNTNINTDISGQSGEFDIGQRYLQGSHLWNGGIDEVAIWNRALSADEITTLYNVGTGFGLINPVISSVASSTTLTTATITWNTDKLATSTVEYGATDSYGTASSSAEFATSSHTIILSGLTASTTYHFRVSSSDALGNLSTSSDMTFVTLSNSGSFLTISGAGTSFANGVYNYQYLEDISAWCVWTADPNVYTATIGGHNMIVYKRPAHENQWQLDEGCTTNLYTTGSPTDLTTWSTLSGTPPAPTGSLSGSSDTTPPNITSTASSTTATTATITWDTDEAATSTVEYGATDSYGTASSSAEFATSSHT
ncbi:MAG: LamG-like jellyroll fold domain-containing protein, partial [Candidatus Paceibacterota bacterium]